MKLLCLLPLTACLLTPVAYADDCDNATTQGDMNACAGRQYQAADKALNSVYQQITQRLKADADTKKLLVGAQRSWVTFRDAECEFAASGVSGGSVYPLIHLNCLTAQTTSRTQALKQYLKCQEGDMGCPVPAQ
ncbi:MAG: lysozyme inhibitor LprI family protein [Janthinobacterium lividum]